MSTLRRKRSVLALSSLGTVAAVAALVTGATTALFSSTANSSGSTFATGNVVLTGASTDGTSYPAGSQGSSTCSFTAEPGGTPGQITINGAPRNIGVPFVCDYNLSYTGSMQAFILLNVSTTSTAGPATTPSSSQTQYGGEALIDGTSSGLNVGVYYQPVPATTPSDIQTLTIGNLDLGSSGTTPAACTPQDSSGTVTPAGFCASTFSTADGQLVAATGQGGQGGNKVGPGWKGTIQVEGYLPATAGNEYEGGTAQVTVTASAIQSDNNTWNGGYPWSSAFGPIAQGVHVTSEQTGSGTGTATITYDEPVSFTPTYVTHPALNFGVQDVTQVDSAHNRPDTCTVPDNSVSVNGDQLTFSFTCSTPSRSGDLFDVFYTQNGGDYVMSTGTPSQYAQYPQAFWNQSAS